MCAAGKTRCAAYTRLIEQAGIEQLQAIFLGAAICAVIAAVAAVLCFRERPHPWPRSRADRAVTRHRD